MSDRFVGINDDGYGVFEQGVEENTHKLIIQDPSGRVRTALNKAQSYDIWGPLSPLTTAGDSMVIPFLRSGKHFFAVMTVAGEGASTIRLPDDVRAATFDGTTAFVIQKNGSVGVATGGAASTETLPHLKGNVFWTAAGNNSLLVATSVDTAEKSQVSITSIGN
ncbi:hypothetical protein GCM10022254_60600 [Actinomadura meridiana]|uniref:Uncharacterized protein n=1 Tax=Actinomadura meridiana TaxID=559626 RepID=A0ABP8CIC5_9ACTN